MERDERETQGEDANWGLRPEGVGRKSNCQGMVQPCVWTRKKLKRINKRRSTNNATSHVTDTDRIQEFRTKSCRYSNSTSEFRIFGNSQSVSDATLVAHISSPSPTMLTHIPLMHTHAHAYPRFMRCHHGDRAPQRLVLCRHTPSVTEAQCLMLRQRAPSMSCAASWEGGRGT